MKLAKQLGAGKTPAPRLVPVEIIEPDVDEERGWELRTAAGHVLRVYNALTDTQLEEILAAMVVVDEATP